MSRPCDRLEINASGDVYVRLVWALKPGKPQIVAICTTDEEAEARRDYVQRFYPGAVFYIERSPLDHVFGERDMQSMIYRAAPHAAINNLAFRPGSSVRPQDFDQAEFDELLR